jgi:F0F1-type ATP synthase assembly protein I
MGTELAGAVCGMTLAGYWIDRHFGTGNKGVMILATLGLVGGMYNFIRQALELSKRTQTRPHGHDDPNSKTDDRSTGRSSDL